MTSRFGSSLAALGFLRLGLFILVILDVVLPGGYQLLGLITGVADERFAWVVIPTLIAPVMAPILFSLEETNGQQRTLVPLPANQDNNLHDNDTSLSAWSSIDSNQNLNNFMDLDSGALSD